MRKHRFSDLIHHYVNKLEKVESSGSTCCLSLKKSNILSIFSEKIINLNSQLHNKKEIFSKENFKILFKQFL